MSSLQYSPNALEHEESLSTALLSERKTPYRGSPERISFAEQAENLRSFGGGRILLDMSQKRKFKEHTTMFEAPDMVMIRNILTNRN
jgi:hypothetical protein